MLALNRVALKVVPYIPKPVRQVVKRLLPNRIWLRTTPRTTLRTTSIYPFTMPPLHIEDGLDVLLLEAPMRYMPLIPTGLGYVDVILTKMGVKHQTVDFNLWLYHHFHSRRVLQGLHDIVIPDGPYAGYHVPDDPWTTLSYPEWLRPELPSYFAAELDGLVKDVVAARPKILALSVSETNRLVTKMVAGLVRTRYPEVLILVGGYDCVYPEVIKSIGLDYDYAVIGEAEGTLPGLFRALMNDRAPCDLPGVLAKCDTPGRKWGPGPLMQNLDLLGFPRYDWGLKYYQSYQSQKVVPVVTSRGCVWKRCRFCSDVWQPFRKRSPANVVNELKWFVKRGFTCFTFNDLDPLGNDILGICHEIIKRRLKITFFFQE